ncbi:MAG TPA: SDR family oxidoreductase [Verrucomicrobiae bacterium]|nr:SDR family oxidoreductase [Verrucomicrobiae bacterium]
MNVAPQTPVSDSGWALITGASSGIGYELAKLFAADHFNVVLVARREERLRQLESELREQYRIETRVLVQDLSQPDAAQRIFSALAEVPIRFLINNAGFGYLAPFAEEDLAVSVDLMNVNMASLVKLTRLFAEPMARRRKGYILNVASTAAFQPGPFTAMYYSSKAFVFSFSVALGEELKGTGVSVTVLCPGFTKTEFQFRSKMERPSRWMPCMSAESVARAGYAGLLHRRRIVIPGLLNKIGAALSSRLSPLMTARIVRKINGH